MRRLVIAVCVLFFSVLGTASAVIPSAGWRLDSVAAPTNFLPAANNAECLKTLTLQSPVCDSYEVFAMNAGSEPTDGSPVTLTDTLPEGVTASEARLMLVVNGDAPGTHGEEEVPQECATGSVVRCTVSGSVVPAGDWLRMTVFVTVSEGVPGSLTNHVEASGGGAASGSSESSNRVSSNVAPFGLSRFDFFKDGLNGLEESQAGGHPYELTTTIDFNSAFRAEPGAGSSGELPGKHPGVEDVKDIVVDLPLGFVGSLSTGNGCWAYHDRTADLRPLYQWSGL
jgi:hypothetical protein